MKLTYLMIATGSLLVMLVPACAQNSPVDRPVKPLYNPMYSPHNYKHPHMAAAARQWESPGRRGVAVMKSTGADAGLTNYKRPMPLAQPVGSITLPHRPATSLTDRNYKIQRLGVPVPRIDMKEYYMEQRKTNSNPVGE